MAQGSASLAPSPHSPLCLGAAAWGPSLWGSYGLLLSCRPCRSRAYLVLCIHLPGCATAPRDPLASVLGVPCGQGCPLVVVSALGSYTAGSFPPTTPFTSCLVSGRLEHLAPRRHRPSACLELATCHHAEACLACPAACGVWLQGSCLLLCTADCGCLCVRDSAAHPSRLAAGRGQSAYCIWGGPYVAAGAVSYSHPLQVQATMVCSWGPSFCHPWPVSVPISSSVGHDRSSRSLEDIPRFCPHS